MSDDTLEKNISLWKDVLKMDQQWDFSFLEGIILHKVKLMRAFYVEGQSHAVKESVDKTIEEMTVVIDALERLQKNDYIHFPEGLMPNYELEAEDDKGFSRIKIEYHPDFGTDKVDEVYQLAREKELRDRHLVYDTLRDKSPGWWD